MPKRPARDTLWEWHEQNLEQLLQSSALAEIQDTFLRRRLGIQPNVITTDDEWVKVRDNWRRELTAFPINVADGDPPWLVSSDGREIRSCVWWLPVDPVFTSQMGRNEPLLVSFPGSGLPEIVYERHKNWRRCRNKEEIDTLYRNFIVEIESIAWQYWLPAEIALWAVLNPDGVKARFLKYLDHNPLFPLRWRLHWPATPELKDKLVHAAKSSAEVRSATTHLVPGIYDVDRDPLHPPFQIRPPVRFRPPVYRSEFKTRQEEIRRVRPADFKVEMEFSVDCPDEIIREAAREAKGAVDI
jgi:hypothetical protein